MRLSDADALLARWKAALLHMGKDESGRHPVWFEGVIEAVEGRPTIEAEPVRHGRWEKADNLKLKCSVCGEFHLYAWPDHKKCNYCPNCGAKMDGDDHDKA